MCTLSVVTRADGYLLAMNRDEKIARGAGTPLRIHAANGVKAARPGDGGGGTWIAANQFGIAFALLNWNDVPEANVTLDRPRSRGQVITPLIGCFSSHDVQSALDSTDLIGVRPFRLIGVLPADREIREWRWNARQIETVAHPWRWRHWFSSSLSDKRAETLRGRACSLALEASDSGSSPWLRRLHASHAGEPGPFSLCVHRDNVQTLSYSEIACTASWVHVKHFIGNPCSTEQFDEVQLERLAAGGLPRKAAI